MTKEAFANNVDQDQTAQNVQFDLWSTLTTFLLCPPSKKRGYIALHLLVGPSVGLSIENIFVRSITQKVFQVSSWNYIGG